jgi:hypothetical protein
MKIPKIEGSMRKHPFTTTFTRRNLGPQKAVARDTLSHTPSPLTDTNHNAEKKLDSHNQQSKIHKSVRLAL